MPGMAVFMYVNQKYVFFQGRLTSQERQGGGGWEHLVYCVWLIVLEFIRGDNKALTNEDSRCQAQAGVMYPLVTKAPPNEDESQYAPCLPRKHLHIWLHCQTLCEILM